MQFRVSVDNSRVETHHRIHPLMMNRIAFPVFLLLLAALAALGHADESSEPVDILTPGVDAMFEEEDIVTPYEGGATVAGLQLILRMDDSVFIEGEPVPFTVTFRNRGITELGLVGYNLPVTEPGQKSPVTKRLRRVETIVMAGPRTLEKTQDLSWYGHRWGPVTPKRIVTFLKPDETLVETGDLNDEYRYRGFEPGLVPGEYVLKVRYRNEHTLGNAWRGEAVSNRVPFTVVEKD